MSLFPEAPPTRSSLPFIHAHCDGGSRGNPGPSGYGAIVTDARGATLAELSEFLGIRTNNYAEYSGLLAVLAWALEHGHGRVKVVSDSELMVKQIQGKYKVNSPDLKPLWAEARARIARLDAFEIAHALRHKNKEADALANQAMDRGTDRGMKRSGEQPVQNLPLRPVQVRAAVPMVEPEGSPTHRDAAAMDGARDTHPAKPQQKPEASASGTMHRGFTKGGVVHLLGGATLPDGVIVKIIRE